MRHRTDLEPVGRTQERARPLVAQLTFRVGACIAIAFLITATVVPVLFRGSQRFTDIVVGEIALGGYNKSADFRLAWVFLLVAFVAYAALGLARRLRFGLNPPPGNRYGRMLTAAAP